MITDEQAADAVEFMKVCRFFPSSEMQRAQIAGMLLDMVETKEHLDWLVRAQTKLDWSGPGQLRLLFCSRFQARDAGVDQDPERAYFEREAVETDRRIAAWKKEQKLLGEAPAVNDLTPAIRPVDRTTADLQFERVQQFLGKEIRPTYIPGTAKRTPEENAALVREIETKLGIAAAPETAKKILCNPSRHTQERPDLERTQADPRRGVKMTHIDHSSN